MTFSRCQHENPDDARCCRVCGSPLGRACPGCGRVSAPDSYFCNACGHALAPVPARSELPRGAPQAYTPPHLAEKILTSRSALQGERKHVTVLFCDIANPENRLTVQLGLNTGPVVVGTIGDNLRMDYTAVGDTTNLAGHRGSTSRTQRRRGSFEQ